MAKTTTSKTQKTDVAEKSKVATANAVATEKTETVAEAKTETATVKEGTTANAVATEKTENKGGLPFDVNADGTVNIWSLKRAGKKVIGATGEIVAFDDKGFAKVALEDALHFQKVPGFSFKEEK